MWVGFGDNWVVGRTWWELLRRCQLQQLMLLAGLWLPYPTLARMRAFGVAATT